MVALKIITGSYPKKHIKQLLQNMHKNISLFLSALSLFFCMSCNKISKKVTETPAKISAMTYNIRLDLKSDDINQWDHRKETVLSMIHNYKPTIIGIQEALPKQVSYLQKNLREYGSIGEGRDGGVKGESCTIFYRTDKFQLLSTETFWLSQTPKKPSIGWDAAYPRICTMGVFHHKTSKEKYIVYNTHLDHIGMTAQEQSIQQILTHIDHQNYGKNSVIVMGDFNSESSSPTIKTISKFLKDSSLKFIDNIKPKGTFNGFDIQNTPEKRIDYIFTRNLQISNYLHLDKKTANGNWPSDHLPVFIETTH